MADRRLARAYEFAATSWGWTHDSIESELTDALFVWYLDAAVDRVEESTRAGFEHAVETTRMGTIFAHSQKAYDSWRRSLPRRDSMVGLTGGALEQHVAGLRLSRPDLVKVAP